MANIMTKRGNLDNIVTYQHICDTTADLSNISQEYCTLGSIAIVIEGEGGGLEIYITNSNKQWIPLTVSSTSSGEGVTLAEVNELIADALGDIAGFSIEIVNELPVSDINTGTIYLVAYNNGIDNRYDEYIYVNNNWQLIGSTVNIQQLYNIQDGHGQSSIEEGNLSSSGGVLATGSYSHAEGNETTASGDASHAEGSETTASGMHSHAEGSGTTASETDSHAEGGNTTASAIYAHAEGTFTTASGYDSHAEGRSTTASGQDSHAEGYATIASEKCSHVEGYMSTASGSFSHAEGNGTIANHKNQHVFGSYNIADDNINLATKQGTYIEIVGNGNWYTRSNARTLDWGGNEWLAGTLTTSTSGIKIGNTTLNETQLQALVSLSLEITNPSNDDVLTYDSTSAKWTNKAPTGSSSSGGNLKVLINAETGALDKTWQEIYDVLVAGNSVNIISITDVDSAESYIVMSCAKELGSTYSVTATSINGNIFFRASSKTSYPVRIGE